MPPDLVAHLAGGRLVVAATTDDDGAPYTMVMNSAVAIDSGTIRFAIDHRTHTLRHIRERGRIMIEVLGENLIYGVSGAARVVVEHMQHAPIASAMVQVDVERVKRDLPPGVECEGPAFRWGALEQFMSAVEPKMFEELRAYAPAAT
jgi:hypothetical protein